MRLEISRLFPAALTGFSLPNQPSVVLVSR